MQIQDLQNLNASLDRMLKAWRLRYHLEGNRRLTRYAREFIRGVLAEVVDEEEGAFEALGGGSLTDALEVDDAFKTLEKILGPEAFVLYGTHHVNRVLSRESFPLRPRDVFRKTTRQALRSARSRASLTT